MRCFIGMESKNLGHATSDGIATEIMWRNKLLFLSSNIIFLNFFIYFEFGKQKLATSILKRSFYNKKNANTLIA